MPLALSCKCEYVLLALFELATHYYSGERLQIRQIAQRQNIPDRYLEQLMANLKRAGFVRSIRGANGGYVLAKEPQTITVLDVVSCIEGSELAPNNEDEKPPSLESEIVRQVWDEAQQAMIDILRQCTLADLIEKRKLHQQWGIMYYI
jgi:Rrf2 family protein